MIVRAPNGDLFVAESRANRVRVLRDADGDGKPEVNEVFADGPEPAVRHRLLSRRARARSTSTSATPTRSSASPTRTATLKASGEPETIVNDIPSGDEQRRRRRPLDPRPGVLARRQDAVRLGRLALERRRRRAARSAGPTSSRSTPTARTSGSTPRASATPSAWRSTRRPASSGPRSTSATGWATTSCPTTSPTSRRAASTAGPGTTSAPNQDPRHEGKHPELKDKVIVPDVLLQSHSASLDMTFYDGDAVPEGVPAATPSPPSTARGTARAAPATR